MKKIPFLFLYLLFCTTISFAKTKKNIQIITATCQQKASSLNKTNEIYTIVFSTKKTKLTVDSMWFGGLCIPIDLYKGKTRIKSTDTILPNTTYSLVANKKLYQNYAMADTVAMHKNFVAPFVYTGKPVLYYKIAGKRIYEVIPKIKVLPSQGLR